MFSGLCVMGFSAVVAGRRLFRPVDGREEARLLVGDRPQRRVVGRRRLARDAAELLGARRRRRLGVPLRHAQLVAQPLQLERLQRRHLPMLLDLALHLRVLGRRRDQSQYLDGRHSLVAAMEAHGAFQVTQRTADVLELFA